MSSGPTSQAGGRARSTRASSDTRSAVLDPVLPGHTQDDQRLRIVPAVFCRGRRSASARGTPQAAAANPANRDTAQPTSGPVRLRGHEAATEAGDEGEQPVDTAEDVDGRHR